MTAGDDLHVLDYLRELVALMGVSGAEGDVVRRIVDLARPLADSVEVDPFLCLLGGTGGGPVPPWPGVPRPACSTRAAGDCSALPPYS